MAKGNLFDFPLIVTLAIICYSTELQYFASVDGDQTDMMPPEVKLKVRICSKYNVKI